MSSVLPISARKTGDLARLLEERGYGNQEFQILVSNPDAVIELIKRLGAAPSMVAPNWIDSLLFVEEEALQDFFGREFDLSPARQILEVIADDQLELWQQSGLKLCIFPNVVFTENSTFPGWKIKPGPWYWQKLAAGELLRPNDQGELMPITQSRLEGIVVLIDPRLKPRYNGGKQMFDKDRVFLGEIIAKLRDAGMLSRYDHGPNSSRFGVSANEWQQFVRPAIADKLGLAAHQVRLETALEANVIPQLCRALPRAKDGETTTWVWYEEYFEGAGGRLSGGGSDVGGLADVHFGGVDARGGRAFRPLGVLGTW